jgi:hypothetical protein
MIKYLFTSLLLLTATKTYGMEIWLNFTDTAKQKINKIFTADQQKFLIAHIRVSQGHELNVPPVAASFFDVVDIPENEQHTVVDTLTEICRFDCKSQSLNTQGSNINATYPFGGGLVVRINTDNMINPTINFELESQGDFESKVKLPEGQKLTNSKNAHTFQLDYDIKFGFFFRES